MPRKMQTTIAAGELRHRIQLAAPTGTLDSMGSPAQNTTDFAVVWTCWASIEAYMGGSSMAAQSFVAGSSHWIVMRHPHGKINVTTQMLVWWNGRTFQVNNIVNPTEQNHLLILICTEINQSQQAAPTPVAP